MKRGDTLTHIAATRVGLTVQDLAALNGLSPSAVIQPGQQLVLPTQASLNKAKEGFDTANALLLYMQQHGGRLPYPGESIPSVAEQSFGHGARTITANGYNSLSMAMDARGW